MCQEFGGHDGADGVPTEVLGSGRTAAVTIEAGKRIGATLFQGAAQHIAIGHGPKCLAAPATPSDLSANSARVAAHYSRARVWPGRGIASSKQAAALTSASEYIRAIAVNTSPAFLSSSCAA